MYQRSDISSSFNYEAQIYDVCNALRFNTVDPAYNEQKHAKKFSQWVGIHCNRIF